MRNRWIALTGADLRDYPSITSERVGLPSRGEDKPQEENCARLVFSITLAACLKRRIGA